MENFNRARAIVKVQDGCGQNCAYCIVPQTRGRPLSRQPQEILRECRGLLQSGFAEIMISGVNLRQYGIPGFGDFWNLLSFLDRELAPEYSGRARLRISSLEPAQLNERGVETFCRCRLVCPHVHLSLQHASTKILAAMGRGHYSAESVLDILKNLRGHFPVLGLGADIIAGFPGETEEDLELLLQFLREADLSYAHVFPFSRRQGTIAASLPMQLERREKKARAERIRAAVAVSRKKFLERQLHLEKITVAFDLRHGRIAHGVNEYYASCILPVGAAGRPGLLPAKAVSSDGASLRIELL